jgi:hypothetical protein
MKRLTGLRARLLVAGALIIIVTLVVRVRRTHRELADAIENAPEGDADGPDADAFRWVVSGHWRNQAHGPNRSLCRPIYIEPHLKGPCRPERATTRDGRSA